MTSQIVHSNNARSTTNLDLWTIDRPKHESLASTVTGWNFGPHSANRGWNPGPSRLLLANSGDQTQHQTTEFAGNHRLQMAEIPLFDCCYWLIFLPSVGYNQPILLRSSLLQSCHVNFAVRDNVSRQFDDLSTRGYPTDTNYCHVEAIGTVLMRRNKQVEKRTQET